MKKIQSLTKVITLGLCVAAGSALLPAGEAEAQRGDRWGERQNQPHGWVKWGDHRQGVFIEGSITRGLASAFRNANYHSYVKDGCVYVQVGHRSPGFSVSVSGYNFKHWRDGDCLVYQPTVIKKARYAPQRRVYRDRYEPRYEPRYERRYTPRYRSGYRYGSRGYSPWRGGVSIGYRTGNFRFGYGYGFGGSCR